MKALSTEKYITCFSVGLIKPGLGDELTYQRTTFGDIVHQPSAGFNQQFVVTKPTHISDTSSDSSEADARPSKRFVKVKYNV